jgi:hypothetical protein
VSKALALIVAAVTLGLYADRRAVSDTTIKVNEAVIALLKDILSAQTAIRQSQAEVQTAKDQLAKGPGGFTGPISC